MKSVSERLDSKKVAIYIRVSTHWQIDKDSLQVQRRELIAYSQMVLNIDDYVVFEDPGYSAKNTDRPDYQHMMDRLRTGEFTHLLVWKIDRISRNLLDFANMYDELKELGVTFVSKNEQFDTSSAIGEAMLKIILVFAELERNMTAERVTATMLSRANNGQWNGGRIPYGYNYDRATKEFSLHPDEAPLVRRMFELYEREQSLITICHKLNDKGVHPRSGKRWSPAGVRKILTNVFYIGKYKYNATSQGGKGGYKPRDASEWIVIDNHHEPLIDEHLFERIQFLLKRNRRGGVAESVTYTRKNVHIFAGLLRCGVCGASMGASLDRIRSDGSRPSIYGCSTRRKSKTCTNKYASDLTVAPFMFNYVANIIRSRDKVSEATPLESIEKKLLRGPIFDDVLLIEKEGLEQLRSVMANGRTGMEYIPDSALSEIESGPSEKDTLVARKKKHEQAISRLRSLYLYGDNEMPEKDFIIERQRIMEQITEIDEKLSSMTDDPNPDMSGEEFMEKASYFIMVEKLLDSRTVDYGKYMRKLDPSVPKAFFRAIVKRIFVTDGRVTAIEFKNGMTHRFQYK